MTTATPLRPPAAVDRRALTTTLSDGRTLGWAEFGPSDGAPVLLLHGTPGGRLNRLGDDDTLYDRLGIRLVVPDRAGYGLSSASPGRTICGYAEDVVALLDHLGVKRLPVIGGSGGGPHALGVATLAPERVAVCAIVVGAAPLTAEEQVDQVYLNRRVFERLGDHEALDALLTEARQTLLTEGVAALLTDAAPEDRARLNSDAGLRRAAEVLVPAIEPGIDGWREDYLAIWGRDWGFAPSDVKVPVLWWHGDADRNVPLAAARRLAGALTDVDFRVLGGGHSVHADNLTEILGTVLARALRSA